MKFKLLLCLIILIAALYMSETYKSETHEGFEENIWITMLSAFFVPFFGALIVGGIVLGVEIYLDKKRNNTAKVAAKVKTNL